MITNASLQAFRDYIGIKLHFNQPGYLWNPNHGIRLGESQLAKRKDESYFERIAYKIRDRNDRVQFYISCFLLNPNLWIGEMITDDWMTTHKKRMVRVNSIAHTIGTDVDNLIEYMVYKKYTLRKMLLTTSQAPVIFSKQFDIIGGVSKETLAFLERGFKFASRATGIDPLWKEEAFRITKYDSLLKYEDFDKLVVHYKKLASVAVEPAERIQHGEKENVICST